MITVERLARISVYRVYCDRCEAFTDAGPNSKLIEAYYQVTGKYWEMPPPFPCETCADLLTLTALCPACAEKSRKRSCQQSYSG